MIVIPSRAYIIELKFQKPYANWRSFEDCDNHNDSYTIQTQRLIELLQ